MAETIRLKAKDGVEIGGYLATPSGTPKGHVIVVMEIFGVNHHIKAVTDRLAADGYVALAPQFFDRIPMTHVNELRELHKDVTIYDYPADHGFHCDERGSYDASAAKIAYGRTLEFFAKHLP